MTLSPQIDNPRRYPAVLAALPAGAGLIAIAVGTLVLCGWFWELETLKRVLPALVAMNPLTAVLFICSGSALLMVAGPGVRPPMKTAGRILSALVAVIGLVKLADLFVGWLPNLDEVLFRGDLIASRDAVPNRMAPNTAFNFVLIGLAAMLADLRRKWYHVSQALTILAGFGALLPITGYAYGARSFQGHPAFIPMALHTAIVFFILALGVFFASRSAGLTQVFLNDKPSGILARRLFPLSVFLTLLLGWLRLWGDWRGLYDNAFGTALFAIALCVLLALLVRWAVWTISRLEAERAATNLRLQELSRRKDEMIAIVSHDLCTPLTGFRMVIDIVREDPARARGELLDLMDHSARRMVAMVRGLLDIAKLQSNDVALELSDVRVSDVIRESIEPLTINANAKDISLELSAAPSEPVLRADRLRLSQIFNNLLSNAVKFTPRGGQVSVRVESEGETVRVIVKDTGVGIPPHDLPHVFDKYFQAGTKSTAGEPGTGLGLAIVRDMVRLHAGRIDVESTVGQGTTFIVCLPAEPDGASAFETTGARQRRR
jgi:signal transduction histidine kinase